MWLCGYVHNFQNFAISKIQDVEISKVRKVRFTVLPQMSKFWMIRYEELKLSEDDSLFFSYVLKYFDDKYRVQGSTTGPKNVELVNTQTII